MRVFDTRVQETKYRVLKRLVKMAFDNNLVNAHYEIPLEISPGNKPRLRCCVYKERAITQERINVVLEGFTKYDNVIKVIDIACDACHIQKYLITEACRGCVSMACKRNCPVDAISFVDGAESRATIDYDKCIECGKCYKSCPYDAIIETSRPCEKSCKVGAIKKDESKRAVIDDKLCVMCGACVYNCPFGAITDKSDIIKVVDLLMKSNERKEKIYAMIAPAIASQYNYATPGQIVAAIKAIGFHNVVEVALGADIVLHKESEEFKEKGLMTTSCCPSFVMYIEKSFPELKPYISHTPSPMIETAKLIKKTDPSARVVFIGPCTSKKHEYKLDKYDGIVDAVITFEELQALLDGKDIDAQLLPEDTLDNASYYGRIFAKSGGIRIGINDLLKETNEEELFKPLVASGLGECKIALLKLKKKILKENFIEGMACEGGCINGAGCVNHGVKNEQLVEKYGKTSKETTIHNSVKLYNLHKDKGDK